MSSILDALRKRQIEQAEFHSLRPQLHKGKSGTKASARPLLWALPVVALTALALTVWGGVLLLDRVSVSGAKIERPTGMTEPSAPAPSVPMVQPPAIQNPVPAVAAESQPKPVLPKPDVQASASPVMPPAPKQENLSIPAPSVARAADSYILPAEPVEMTKANPQAAQPLPEAVPQKPVVPEAQIRPSESTEVVSAIPPVSESKFRLEGIVYDEHRPLAIMNGLLYTVGDSVEGRRILSIKKDSVQIEGMAKPLKLRSEK